MHGLQEKILGERMIEGYPNLEKIRKHPFSCLEYTYIILYKATSMKIVIS